LLGDKLLMPEERLGPLGENGPIQEAGGVRKGMEDYQ